MTASDIMCIIIDWFTCIIMDLFKQMMPSISIAEHAQIQRLNMDKCEISSE